MNTLSKQLKKIIAVACAFSVYITNASAQQVSPAKNFAGISGSILWNTTSIAAGVMAERILLSKKNTELSAQASYSFRHRFGNLVLLFSTPYDISSAETTLGIHGYWFTGKQKSNIGFFMSAGTGAIHSNWKYTEGTNAGKTAKNFVKPYGELGLGWKWPIGNTMALRWSNTIKWGTPQPENGGAVITTSTLALGF
jgi:hemolysin activation/secretion protein